MFRYRDSQHQVTENVCDLKGPNIYQCFQIKTDFANNKNTEWLRHQCSCRALGVRHELDMPRILKRSDVSFHIVLTIKFTNTTGVMYMLISRADLMC